MLRFTPSNKRKRVKGARFYQALAPFTLLFLYVIFGLQLELITYCKLEYAVLWIFTFGNICYTEVVTTINNEVVVLVRQTNWDRKIKGIYFYIVFTYAETWLNTELNCKVFNYINVSNYRNVQVAWRPSYSAFT